MPDSRSKAETPMHRGTSLPSSLIPPPSSLSSLPLRLAREYTYQLEHADQHERLRGALRTIPVFVTLYRGESRYEVLRLWAESDHQTMETAYREGLQDWRRTSPDAKRQAEALGFIADMYGAVANWREAERMQQERLEILRQLADRTGESGALSSLAILAWRLGRTDEAERLARQGEEIARELGDRRSIATAVGNRGFIHSNRDEFDEALECFREAEEIARELGDRQRIATAVGNRGMVHSQRRELEEAIECFQQQEAIARELGSRHTLALALGNRGIIHSKRREYDKALPFYREQEEITRELGDRQSRAIALGNRGIAHMHRGEFDEALESLRQADMEHRAIGFLYGVTYWLDGTARVLVEIIESEGAMPEYLAKHLPGATDKTWRTASLQHARACAEECLAISRELSKPDTLSRSQELLARIDELAALADGGDHA